MRVVRVLGTLEPGGAQLSALQLSLALRRHGITTTLLAGDASPAGLALAARHGLPADAFGVRDVIPAESLQWTPSPEFAAWLGPRLAGASLVHGHMFGAWWAAAQALPRDVPLVASEHNQMSWPAADHTPQAREAARRVGLFFAHGPSARAWAAGIGVDDGRLFEGRSSVHGLSARPLPGLPAPRLTFAGRLRGDKAPDVLVEALALMDAPPPAYLIGDGPLRGPLRRLVAARELDAVVHLPGWSFEPPATSPGPASTPYPRGRSHGRKAPCWPWGSASRSSAPRSTASRAPWARAAASWSRRRTPRPRRRTDRRPRRRAARPLPGRAYARQFTPTAAAAIYARAYRHLLARPTTSGNAGAPPP